MSAVNVFSITYGGQLIGGASAYQLHNPYVIEKSYEGFRLVFAVVITAPDHETLKTRSDTLENVFRRRLTFGDTLLINLNGSIWTYTVGRNLLHVVSTAVKSGDPASDKSFSRQYTVTIQAELPADDSNDNGLRSIEVHADYSPSNQGTITVRGTYTATTSGHAVSNYQSRADAEIAHYLTIIDSAATFELVKEDYSLDRERTGGTTPYPHVCNFTRQYVEIMATQSVGTFDDPEIKDSRITYSEVGAFPGDGVASLDRLRRVVGTYDCAVDSVETDDLQAVYDPKIIDKVKAMFANDFNPTVYAIEEFRTSYDESARRISASFTFLYQANGGHPPIEVAYTVTYREARTLDYTPTHAADELAAYVDIGWMVKERVLTRRVVVVGNETPKFRLTAGSEEGDAGWFVDDVAGVEGPDARDGTQINMEGWNMISQSSEVVPTYVGDSKNHAQMRICTLTEQVVERFNTRPGNRTTTPRTGGGAITPR